MAAKTVGKKVMRSAVSVFFEYDTPRIVHIRSKKVGIINRFIQLVIIGYVVGYAIIWKKGYQSFDDVQSGVTTKVKGIIYTNDSLLGPARTWDVADYVIPPQEANAFFVMTRVIPTYSQTQSTCPEDPSVSDANCTNSHSVCISGTIFSKGNGPATGDCVNSTIPGMENTKMCEISAWCPLENDRLNTSVFLETANFTVFIKNNIEFPKFGVQRRNIRDDLFNDSTFSNCRWNASDARLQYCPIFVLKDITATAGYNYPSMIAEGGVMQIVVDWTCNLDYSEDDCWPEYSFRRLDKGDFSISKGFNFRFADRYRLDNLTMYRDLYKATGIRFLITVQGRAGKFDFVNLFMNIGSGMALLGIATILCDIVVLYVLKSRHFYKEKKYLDVKGQDAFEVLEEESEEDQPERNYQTQRHSPNKTELTISGGSTGGGGTQSEA